MALGTLNFYADKVLNLQFDGATPVFTVQLLCENTSSQSFTINSISARVFSNNYEVGSISNFGRQVIAANSQVFVTVNIRLQLISLTNELIRAFQFGNFGQTLHIQGAVNVDDFNIPINMDFQLGKAAGVTGVGELREKKSVAA